MSQSSVVQRVGKEIILRIQIGEIKEVVERRSRDRFGVNPVKSLSDVILYVRN